MQTVVIVIHLMIVVVMIGAVLVQKSDGAGGFGSGGGAGVMTSRGTANLLTRTTSIMAAGLFVTSLFLSWHAGLGRQASSLVGAPAAQTLPAGNAARTSGGVLDALRNADTPTQPVPGPR